MATLQYRGSIVGDSEAVIKPSIASYRGSTYNPQEVDSTPKAHKFVMNYRGATLEV
tara:strand:- start:179 stop:346 length:168 start_codon:yes stop_codon:yes gene_type:complete